MTGWLGSAFLYAYAATQIPAGLLVDNWGPRRTMLLLFGMGGVGGLLFASAASLGTALAGRALVGVGMAVGAAMSMSITEMNKKNGKQHKLSRALRTMGDMVENIGTSFGM